MEPKIFGNIHFHIFKKNRFKKKQKKTNSLFIIFKNYNFKDIIAILKIISLIGHKVYEISLKVHNYHFLL